MEIKMKLLKTMTIFLALQTNSVSLFAASDASLGGSCDVSQEEGANFDDPITIIRSIMSVPNRLTDTFLNVALAECQGDDTPMNDDKIDRLLNGVVREATKALFKEPLQKASCKAETATLVQREEIHYFFRGLSSALEEPLKSALCKAVLKAYDKEVLVKAAGASQLLHSVASAGLDSVVLSVVKRIQATDLQAGVRFYRALHALCVKIDTNKECVARRAQYLQRRQARLEQEAAELHALEARHKEEKAKAAQVGVQCSEDRQQASQVWWHQRAQTKASYDAELKKANEDWKTKMAEVRLMKQEAKATYDRELEALKLQLSEQLATNDTTYSTTEAAYLAAKKRREVEGTWLFSLAKKEAWAKWKQEKARSKAAFQAAKAKAKSTKNESKEQAKALEKAATDLFEIHEEAAKQMWKEETQTRDDQWEASEAAQHAAKKVAEAGVKETRAAVRPHRARNTGRVAKQVFGTLAEVACGLSRTLKSSGVTKGSVDDVAHTAGKRLGKVIFNNQKREKLRANVAERAERIQARQSQASELEARGEQGFLTRLVGFAKRHPKRCLALGAVGGLFSVSLIAGLTVAGGCAAAASVFAIETCPTVLQTAMTTGAGMVGVGAFTTVGAVGGTLAVKNCVKKHKKNNTTLPSNDSL